MTVLTKRVKADASTSTIVPVDYCMHQTLPSVIDTVIGTYNCTTEHYRNHCVGWDIPDFHRRKKNGELLEQTPWRNLLINGEASGFYSNTQGSPAGGPYTTVQTYFTDTVSDWTQGHPSNWMITEEEVAAAVPAIHDMYVTEAAAKIYSEGYDALTALAELTELRSLFAGTAKKLLQFQFPKKINKYKNSDWGEITSAWLLGRYGWRTLFYDITAINEAIRNFDEVRTRCSAKSGSSWTTTDSVVDSIDNISWGYDKVTSTKVNVSVRGSVVADIVVPKFQFNPLQTGWELIPFSFVVDWFLNVGKTLSALNFITTATDYKASKGYKVTMERDVGIQNVWYTNQPTFDFISFQFTLSSRSVAVLENRTPCRVPITPSFITRLNPFKVMDLLALITQRFPRR